jgi:phenylalanine-4-hydroxylase
MDEIRRPIGVREPTVSLSADHPGFSDAAYRRRRDAIAAAAAAYRPGAAIPEVHYTPEEDALWQLVSAELAEKHREYACAEYLAAARRLDLPSERVPQLREVSDRIDALSGFRIEPVAGLVSTRQFYGSLGDRRFLATQYIRHHSVPFYTPEPDVVHELIGHAVSLANPDFALLNRRFGEVACTLPDDAMQPLIRAYWYSLEFGVIRDGGALKVYGAGLLSSFGECGRFETAAELVPFDLDVMADTPFDPTDYQRTVFVAPSFEAMKHALLDWLARRAR